MNKSISQTEPTKTVIGPVSINRKVLIDMLIGATTVPVVKNDRQVHISVSKNTLSVRSSRIGIVYIQEVSVLNDSAYGFCHHISPEPILNLLRLLTSERLHLFSCYDSLRIECSEGQYDFFCFEEAVDNSPVHTTNEVKFSLSKESFINAINLAKFAMASDDKRKILSAILIESDDLGRIKFVATDTHRLSVACVYCLTPKKIRTVIPRDCINTILNSCGGISGNVSIAVSENGDVISFVTESGNRKSIVQALSAQGQFPDYMRVVPSPSENKLTVHRLRLIQSLKRVTLFAKNGAGNRVVFRGFPISKDSIAITTVENRIGEFKEQHEAKLSFASKDGIEVSYNAKYLLDVLSAVRSEYVEIAFDGALRPCLLTPNPTGVLDYYCVLMPMQIF